MLKKWLHSVFIVLLFFGLGQGFALEKEVKGTDLVDSWKVLNGAGVDDVVRRNIDELELVSKNIDEIKAFDSGYDAWKINRNAGGKVFKEILIDIPKAINKKLPHITSAEMVTKNGTTFRLTGVHSNLSKTDIYIVTKQGKKIVSRIKTTDYIVDLQKIDDGLEGVYTAKVVIKDLQGNVIVTKSGNGGVSTFFPNGWSKSKIASEVEFAIKNNKGYIDPTDVNPTLSS